MIASEAILSSRFNAIVYGERSLLIELVGPSVCFHAVIVKQFEFLKNISTTRISYLMNNKVIMLISQKLYLGKVL